MSAEQRRAVIFAATMVLLVLAGLHLVSALGGFVCCRRPAQALTLGQILIGGIMLLAVLMRRIRRQRGGLRRANLLGRPTEEQASANDWDKNRDRFTALFGAWSLFTGAATAFGAPLVTVAGLSMSIGAVGLGYAVYGLALRRLTRQQQR